MDFQRLTIYLKGGQTISVDFKIEEATKLNVQIDSFIKALGDPAQKEKNFLFQGARVVLVRVSDVSAIDVVSMTLKERKRLKSQRRNRAHPDLLNSPGNNPFSGFLMRELVVEASKCSEPRANQCVNKGLIL